MRIVNKNKNTHVYVENPRRKKSLIEEKKIHCQKLVQERRDASFYYISINIITLNLIHHHIYICGRVINKVSPYHGGLPLTPPMGSMVRYRIGPI